MSVLYSLGFGFWSVQIQHILSKTKFVWPDLRSIMSDLGVSPSYALEYYIIAKSYISILRILYHKLENIVTYVMSFISI